MQGREQNWGSLKAHALCTKNKRRFKVHFLVSSPELLKRVDFFQDKKRESRGESGLVGANYYF